MFGLLKDRIGPPSNGEVLVDFPVPTGDVVLVEVLLLVVPANCVESVLDLEDHGTERSDGWQVGTPLDCLVVGVVNEAGVRSVLPVETAEDQDGGRADFVGHGQIAGHP